MPGTTPLAISGTCKPNWAGGTGLGAAVAVVEAGMPTSELAMNAELMVTAMARRIL